MCVPGLFKQPTTDGIKSAPSKTDVDVQRANEARRQQLGSTTSVQDLFGTGSNEDDSNVRRITLKA